MTWQEIELSDSNQNTARGRNGWFAPTRALVFRSEAGVSLDVFSARNGDMAPIILRLTDGDASQLIEAVASMLPATMPLDPCAGVHDQMARLYEAATDRELPVLDDLLLRAGFIWRCERCRYHNFGHSRECEGCGAVRCGNEDLAA